MADIYGLFDRYFLEPTLTKSGYNVVNTLTYIAVLAVSLFLVRKLLKRMRIDTDDNLWKGLLPFVFLGGILRALEDAGFWDFLGVYRAIFITPMLYFVIFAVAFSAVLVSKYLGRRLLMRTGVALLAVFLAVALSKASNPVAVFIALVIFAASYAGFFGLQRILGFNVVRSLASPNSQVLASHLLDAAVSFTSVSVIGGYFESSVGSSMIFSHLPGWSFILIKGAVILVVLRELDKDAKGDWNWLIKFTLLVLGLAPAVHDIFTLMMGRQTI